MAERKIFNKRNDPEFKYVIRINPQLEKWRSLAAEWFKDQKRGRSVRRVAIDKFFLSVSAQVEADNEPLFSPSPELCCSVVLGCD